MDQLIRNLWRLFTSRPIGPAHARSGSESPFGSSATPITGRPIRAFVVNIVKKAGTNDLPCAVLCPLGRPRISLHPFALLVS
jgi:hypothetical protein